jgi:hypothetical protein
MTTGSTTLPDAVRYAVLYQLANVHTALPGIIVSYDYTKQNAQVQPTINRTWSDGTTIKLPVLNNVPVIFPQSGGASLTFPVNVGDPCLLIFNERSTDQWKASGGIVNPVDPRKFDLSDGVALMGYLPFNSTFPNRSNNTDMILQYAGSSITITSTGAIKINTASTLALGTPTNELINQLNTFFTALSVDPEFDAIFDSATIAALATLITNLTALDGTLP